MEFCEAIFCIYILFNRNASTVIRLNRDCEARLARGVSTGHWKRWRSIKIPIQEIMIPATGEPNAGEDKDGKND